VFHIKVIDDYTMIFFFLFFKKFTNSLTQLLIEILCINFMPFVQTKHTSPVTVEINTAEIQVCEMKETFVNMQNKKKIIQLNSFSVNIL
jgi:hypothetical protein